jgi:hypothetical protein
MLPTKFRFIWLGGFREEDFFKSANQKQELPMVAMFVNESAAWPNESKLGRKHPWKVLYKDCSFGPNRFTNVAATDNSCF